jgi:hypothetical protein
VGNALLHEEVRTGFDERISVRAVKNLGLELAIAFAWAEWNRALQEALRETNTKGSVSEATLVKVEILENAYNGLVAVRADIAQYGLSSSSSSM